MLDEIQALSTLPNGDSIVATLRAVLQKRKKQVSAVITGSSQEELAALVAAAGGPMYQFAQLLDFLSWTINTCDCSQIISHGSTGQASRHRRFGASIREDRI